eukprot:scaffold7242_cov400-Prasinococcus_capsulatus_cf.AAC.21
MTTTPVPAPCRKTWQRVASRFPFGAPQRVMCKPARQGRRLRGCGRRQAAGTHSAGTPHQLCVDAPRACRGRRGAGAAAPAWHRALAGRTPRTRLQARSWEARFLLSPLLSRRSIDRTLQAMQGSRHPEG